MFEKEPVGRPQGTVSRAVILKFLHGVTPTVQLSRLHVCKKTEINTIMLYEHRYAVYLCAHSESSIGHG